MANRWPIANGNWSDAAIWSGSLIPTSADDVYANNRLVYVDVDVTVRSINNATSASAITLGGCFFLNNGITLTSNITGSALAIGFAPVVAITGSNSAKIIGNITMGSGNNICAVTMSDSSTLSITGSLIGGTTGIPGTPGRLLSSNSTGNLYISGSVSAGQNAANGGAIFLGNITNTFIDGNLTGPTSIGGPAVNNSSLATVRIKGNVAGSIAGYGIATVVNNSLGTIVITGSITSGNTGTTIQSTTNGTIIISGSISASSAIHAVSSTGTQATNIFTGPFYNTGSFNAIYAYRMQIVDPASTSWRFDTEVAGGSKTLYTPNQLPGVPRQNNVRKGTQYNFGLTGSLEMPDPTTVKSGVATDNTVGSAILTAQDMFDVLTQDITQTGSIGETLDNVSTVQTVAATVSAFKV